ncbi:MAG: hypothetical protein ACRDJY_10250, partial [Thermoleophilaceae bacterium]
CKVDLVDAPVTDGPEESEVLVTFNAFLLYLAAGGRYPTGFRLLHVWPTTVAGPWLAFEVTVLDQLRTRDLHEWLTSPFSLTSKERAARLLGVLAGGSE